MSIIVGLTLTGIFQTHLGRDEKCAHYINKKYIVSIAFIYTFRLQPENAKKDYGQHCDIQYKVILYT